GDDVARFGGASAGHVLGGGNGDDEVDRQRHLRGGLDGTQHAGGAAHVVLHFVHLARRLERNAAGVEGDALADEDDRFIFLLAVQVLQDNELGRLVRTLGDGEQGVHAQLFHVGAFEDFQLHLVLVGQRLGG